MGKVLQFKLKERKPWNTISEMDNDTQKWVKSFMEKEGMIAVNGIKFNNNCNTIPNTKEE